MKTILQFIRLRTVSAVLFAAGIFYSANSYSQCTASFNAFPDSAGTGVSFVSTSTGTSNFTNYFWTFGDGSTGTGSNVYHQYASAGLYPVCLTIFDTTTACQSTTCDSVYAGPNGGFACQAMFMYQANGLTVSFLDQSIGNNLNYYWDFGDGFSVNGQNATHTYLLAG